MLGTRFDNGLKRFRPYEEMEKEYDVDDLFADM